MFFIFEQIKFDMQDIMQKSMSTEGVKFKYLHHVGVRKCMNKLEASKIKSNACKARIIDDFVCE